MQFSASSGKLLSGYCFPGSSKLPVRLEQNGDASRSYGRAKQSNL
jgi:hypothetical protein